MSELLPCPSCGSDELFIEGKRICQVRCGSCDMVGPAGEWDEGINRWNSFPRAECDRKLPTTTEGTSDRVMLAGLAMQGILASDTERSLSYELAIELAVSIADALLAELAKGER